MQPHFAGKIARRNAFMGEYFTENHGRGNFPALQSVLRSVN